MSTRSWISYKSANGIIRSVYSHWNGSPNDNGRILLENYSTTEALDRLFKDGEYISVLGDSPLNTKYNDGAEGEYFESASFKEVREYWKSSWCDYGYYFDGIDWHCICGDAYEDLEDMIDDDETPFED